MSQFKLSITRLIISIIRLHLAWWNQEFSNCEKCKLNYFLSLKYSETSLSKYCTVLWLTIIYHVFSKLTYSVFSRLLIKKHQDNITKHPKTYETCHREKETGGRWRKVEQLKSYVERGIWAGWSRSSSHSESISLVILQQGKSLETIEALI